MIFLVPVLAFILLVVGIGQYLSDPGYLGPPSDHFNGRTFKTNRNRKINGYKEILKLIATRKPASWTKNYETYQYPHKLSSLGTEECKITFVNHSSFLIQVNGLNILTDPIWSERCSPFQWAGPQRMRPPGIPFENLPHIDIVLISHNHYDHLDILTLQKLETEYQPHYIVPLGVDKTTGMQSFKHMTTLDWKSSWQGENIKISMTEAIHYGSRGLFDRNRTLCGGYVIESNRTIYYVGDTAYDPQLFKNISKDFPKLDGAIIPIGAYKPRWFMQHIHVDPQEAYQIHKDIQSNLSIACHFGTFPLADDGPYEAADALRKCINDDPMATSTFIIPDEGKGYEIPKKH